MNNNCHQLEILVSKETIDRNGHVNNLFYLQWMNDVAIAHADSLGSSIDECLALGGSWFARTHTMTYLGAAFEDEHLVISTWVSELNKISCQRHYSLVRQSDNKELFKAETYWIFASAKTGKPMKIPTLIYERFAAVVVAKIPS